MKKRLKKAVRFFFEILVKCAISQIDWNSAWDFFTERCPEFLRMLFGVGG